MPLYIKDPEVDHLVSELITLKKTSKVEAVKAAIRHEIDSHKRKLPVRQRLIPTLTLAREIGPFGLGDEVQATDAMRGEK